MSCILVNLRSKDRDGQQNGLNDDNTQYNKCTFSLQQPIISRSGTAKIGVKNAMLPVSYHNIEKGVNDRFLLVLETSGATEANKVFVVVQLQAGHYDTTAQLATEIQTPLGLLTDGASNKALPNDGTRAVRNLYQDDTGEPFLDTASFSVAVSTDANTRGNIVVTLLANASFHADCKQKDGDAISTALLTEFAIMFGVDDKSGVLETVEDRALNLLMGFGSEVHLPQADGTFERFGNTRANEAATSVVTSPVTASIIRTPYIYIRCNLVSNSRDSRVRGAKSNIIDKVPLSETSQGTLLFHEPQNTTMATFRLSDDVVNTIEISLTDSDNKLLEFKEQNWEMELKFEGDFMD